MSKFFDVITALIIGFVFSLLFTVFTTHAYDTFFHVQVDFWELWTIVISCVEASVMAVSYLHIRGIQ